MRGTARHREHLPWTNARLATMHQSKVSWLAWALCALVAGLRPVVLALTFAGPNDPLTAPTVAKIALETIAPIVFGIIAALIVAHQPRNTIGWLLMALALGLPTLQIVDGYLPLAIAASATSTPTILLIVWFSQWSWWLVIGPLLLIVLLFPTGRPPTPRWRWSIFAIGALFGILLAVGTFGEYLLENDTNVRLR